MPDPCARWRQLFACDDIVGRSPALASALESAWEAARCDLPVLLLGETGTGKSRFAQLLHEASRRADRKLVTVACNTVPETLFDAHLFGAHKGAYTGAVAMEGFVSRAEGGTLFLDEIGELPPFVQTKLLNLLQSGSWSPLGSTRDRRADVRVIAATNADVSALRIDLYHRLSGFVIRLPSLAERVEDIPLLASAIRDAYARKKVRPPLPFGDDLVQVLLAGPWPGNVRALENAVHRGLERAWLRGDSQIGARHVSPEEAPTGRSRLHDKLRAFERWLVERALVAEGHRVAETAAVLGVSKSWIYKLMGK